MAEIVTQAVDGTTKRIAALIAYDGTDYCGFQYQVAQPSIQATLEKALSKFCKFRSRVLGSGRTDTGVHANGQVVAVQVEWKHSLQAFQQAWNVHLPRSIVIRDVCIVPETFHPRFSALKRTYRYYVIHKPFGNSSVQKRSPLSDRFALFETSVLDIDAMQVAGSALVGIHDFATFGQPTQGENTVREVFEARWQVFANTLPLVVASGEQALVFTITANGFLRHMVRNVVGTLLEVGRGRVKASQIESLIQMRQRALSAPPAPGKGLVLEHVTYSAVWSLSF